MQVKQIKDNQNQQSMEGTSMNAKPLTNIKRESGARIPKPLPPVIDVDDDHCLNDDTPSLVIPSVVANEVCGRRMVVKENPINMQEREPKGRGLTQALATIPIHSITEKHDQSKGSMAKDMGNKASTNGQVNTPKNKNKHSKKKRKAIKKRQAEEQNMEQVHNAKTVGLNACNKFIMEKEQQALDVIPLKAKYNSPTPSKPHDKSKLQTIGPPRDEYDIENSEDEVNADNQPINVQDEDDETILSPRGIHLERIPLKKSSIPVPGTARRPNTRGINTQGVIERLNNIHHLSVIVVLEPFSNNSQIQLLAMDQVVSNSNGKIWLFRTFDITCNVMETDEQQITCEFKHVESLNTFLGTSMSLLLQRKN
ncbi:hypothetical protein H5410_047037 [Solanum commersonii]|uniref:Uncharacterized protein n=1 Tax=Solanum commersonii TaxID=4109 RepID=A0A9J5XDZ6_SOLCO|nr:hypothetical protein H5410_047037 [Solanum commersonii]